MSHSAPILSTTSESRRGLDVWTYDCRLQNHRSKCVARDRDRLGHSSRWWKRWPVHFRAWECREWQVSTVDLVHRRKLMRWGQADHQFVARRTTTAARLIARTWWNRWLHLSRDRARLCAGAIWPSTVRRCLRSQRRNHSLSIARPPANYSVLFQGWTRLTGLRIQDARLQNQRACNRLLHASGCKPWRHQETTPCVPIDCLRCTRNTDCALWNRKSAACLTRVQWSALPGTWFREYPRRRSSRNRSFQGLRSSLMDRVVLNNRRACVQTNPAQRLDQHHSRSSADRKPSRSGNRYWRRILYSSNLNR